MAIKLKEKLYKIINTYLDMSILLIPVAYLISFFFAVNAKDAFDLFLLYSSYFMMYKLVSELSAKDDRYKNVFINVIIASAFLLSFTSMLHLAGIVNIKGTFIGNKLFGLYQYANTTASVLGVGIILSLNKLINEDNIKAKVIYQMILTALIPAFIFTLSRGGYLVLVAVMFVNFILVRARAKIKMIMGLVVSFLSGSVLIYKYYSLAENLFSGIWVQYLISIMVSAFFIYIIYVIISRFNRTFTDRSINTTLVIISIIFIGAAAFLLTAKGPDGYKYIPKDIVARLSDINLTTESVSLRMQFAKDGLKIIKDYPIIGAGGGAWRNLYRQYQSIPYNTTEVHNFYVQYGAEVGIIGLVILAGLIVLLVMSMIKVIKSSSQYLYVYIAAILLFLHSMIDFNLSLAAVGYILWMLIGIINSDKKTPPIGITEAAFMNGTFWRYHVQGLANLLGILMVSKQNSLEAYTHCLLSYEETILIVNFNHGTAIMKFACTYKVFQFRQGEGRIFSQELKVIKSAATCSCFSYSGPSAPNSSVYCGLTFVEKFTNFVFHYYSPFLLLILLLSQQL
jgi:O-antigen ligase